MWRFAVLIFSGLINVGVFAETQTSSISQDRIVGGSPVDIKQYPHQISLRYYGRHRCGGAIESQNIIVTAAHCVIGVDVEYLTVVAGSSYLSKPGIEIPVREYIIHEKYKTFNNDYDAAILVLNGTFTYSDTIQPIGLATERAPHGADVIVTGWGATNEGDYNLPDQLQGVTVKVIENSSCKSSYFVLLTSRMLCAGVENGGKDACQGDSGGPLIHNNKLLGIVSWGTGCARAKYPGVYAAVSELHEWLIATAAPYGLPTHL